MRANYCVIFPLRLSQVARPLEPSRHSLFSSRITTRSVWPRVEPNSQRSSIGGSCGQLAVETSRIHEWPQECELDLDVSLSAPIDSARCIEAQATIAIPVEVVGVLVELKQTEW